MTKLKTNIRVDVITSNNSVSNVDLLVNFLSLNSRKATEDIRQIAAGLLAVVELSEVCNLGLNQLMNYGFSGKQTGTLLLAFKLFNLSIIFSGLPLGILIDNLNDYLESNITSLVVNGYYFGDKEIVKYYYTQLGDFLFNCDAKASNDLA